MSVQNTRRVLLLLLDRVTAQEPDAQTIARGDQVIQVDLATPLVPPVPAAIALVLLTTGTAAKVRQSRRRRVQRKPLADVDVVVDMPSRAPISISTPDGHMVRSAITFTLERRQGDWVIEPKDDSLLAHPPTHV
jgi:hypothetical protein